MVAKGKEKSVFFCQECGYESAKWLGKCPDAETGTLLWKKL